MLREHKPSTVALASTINNLMLYSLTHQIFVDYQEQKIFFVIYAEVRYWDLFQVEHYQILPVHRCGQTGKGVTAEACTSYNWIDNNY